MSEKQKRKAIEELSAFLDGEAINPEDIELRVKADPDAARLAKDLSALSAELGRLPAPDIHPAFRTRVMANVRETDRDLAPPQISWPWRSFAAMVVLAPFAAAFWTFWWSPPAIPEADSQRALVHYLFEQDENVVIDELASLFADDVGVADGEWTAPSNSDALEDVEDSEWLDVLAMDSSFMALDGAWSSEELDIFTDDELQEFERLLLNESIGDATI